MVFVVKRQFNEVVTRQFQFTGARRDGANPQKYPQKPLTNTTYCGSIALFHYMMWSSIMNCPYCGYHDSKVIDSRNINESIRRRRQCLSCDSRFTTHERLQPASLFIIKKDKRREGFSRDKLLTGIRKA